MMECFETSQIERGLAFFDENVVLHQPPSLPVGGEWRGHAGIIELFPAITDIWVDRKSVHDEMMASGDSVAVFCTISGMINGHPIAMRLIETFKLKDDKVIEAAPFFFDTGQIIAALQSAS